MNILLASEYAWPLPSLFASAAVSFIIPLTGRPNADQLQDN